VQLPAEKKFGRVCAAGAWRETCIGPPPPSSSPRATTLKSGPLPKGEGVILCGQVANPGRFAGRCSAVDRRGRQAISLGQVRHTLEA
jgi:hypothetical protein